MASTVHVINAFDGLSALKRLAALAQLVDDLQAQLAALEEKVAALSGGQCPKCKRFAFRLMESRPAPGAVGALHLRAWVYRCTACNHTDVHQMSALGSPQPASVSVGPAPEFILQARAITQLGERV